MDNPWVVAGIVAPSVFILTTLLWLVDVTSKEKGIDLGGQSLTPSDAEEPTTSPFGPWHSVTGDKYHFMPDCTFGQFSGKVSGKGGKPPCEHCVGLGNMELGRPWGGAVAVEAFGPELASPD